MATAKQFWSPADGLVFLAGSDDPATVVRNPTSLNATQKARVMEAVGLWDDISQFTAVQAVDDDSLAKKSTTLITVTEYFLGIPYNTYTYWENALPNDWTRVLVGDIASANILGINKSFGSNGRYHEVYVDVGVEGLGSFQLGSRAFYTVVHEVGHSLLSGHITGSRTQTVMNASEPNDSSIWYPATPMTLDINAAIAAYGASSTTRVGNDHYGFNAQFSGPYRAAFDFTVNTRLLVTVYDDGGIDTLDGSGFRNTSQQARAVSIDLQPGHSNSLLDGNLQTFAVIYVTSWIENAVGGGGNDRLVGNVLNNLLTGAGGNDTIIGGDGIDTAIFSGFRSAYAAKQNADGGIIVADIRADPIDGTDTLYGVELFKFSDRVAPYSLVEILTSAGSVSITDVTVVEGNSGTKVATFTVTRTGGTAAFAVNYGTADGTATVADGDYVASSGTLTFAAGINSQTVSVTVKGDTKFEADEMFLLNLSGATNGAVIGDGQGLGTISNDDAQPPGTVTVSDVTVVEGNSGTKVRYELTRPLTGTEIPSTLQDSLMARLDRLAPAKAVAQLGAAIGREFESSLLLAISGLRPEAVTEGLEQLLAAGLLFSRQQDTTTTYIFKHALIQDAAYSTMLRQRRREVHDRIARALIGGGSDQRPELIAHHFEAAANAREAAVWLERGGDLAFASASHKEALVLWRRALGLLAPDDDGQRTRIGLLQKLSAALLQDGYSSLEAFEAGESALQAAIESGDRELYVRVCASNAPTHFARQDFDRVERELAYVSSAQIGELSPIVRAQYYSIRGICRFHVGHITDACKDLSAILDVKDDARRDSSFGGGDSRCSSMSYLSRSQLIFGLPITARNLAHEALNRARAINHPYSIAWCLVTVTRNALVLGQYSEVLRTIRESIELCERYGYGSRLGQARAAHGIAIVATGDSEGGATELDAGLALWRKTGNNFSLDMLLVEAANMFFRMGNVEQARRYVAQARILYSEVEERTGYSEYLRMSGRLLELDGDRMGATGKYREAVAFADLQSANLHKLRACSDLAMLLATDGDHRAAKAVLQPTLEWFTEGSDAFDIAAANQQLERIRSS